MRKKLLAMCAVFAVICIAGTMASFPVKAGISTNSPTGSGLMTGGALNETDFIIRDDSTPSAYSTQKGNTTYQFVTKGWRNEQYAPLAKIPKADLVAGSKIEWVFDIYSFGAPGQQFYFSSFEKTLGTPISMFGIFPNDANCRLFSLKDKKIYLGDSTTEVTISNGDYSTDTEAVGFNRNNVKAEKAKGREYMTYWFEYNIDDLSIQTYYGYENGATVEKHKGVKIMNAYTLHATAESFYMSLFFDGIFEVDNMRLIRKLGDTDKVYCRYDNEDSKTRAIEWTNDGTKFLDNGGKGNFKSYLSEVSITNPQADSKISSINKLAVDNNLAKTFEMEVDIQLSELAATRKAGIAFGLKDYKDKLSAPANGASLLYFTLADSKVMLGVDNIAATGVATAVGEQKELTGLTVGNESASINLKIVGKKGNNIDVTVNDAATAFTFEGLKLDGAVAIAQTGTGNLKFKVNGNTLKTTGFVFTSNDNDTDVITSKFDHNYINSNKFMQSTVSSAPTSHMVKGATTSHDITGITAEDGKIGFYGTSTNSRLMFNQNQYADFVMQFDYISNPVKTRGVIGSDVNRYSPFYVIFGSKDAQVTGLENTYALGIVEGNVSHKYFWGAESLINPSGKMSTEGNSLAVTSGMTKLTAETPEAIPCYTSPTDKTVAYWGMPSENALFSFYNKTSRIKLVVINNKVGLYAATVGANNAITGEYVLVYQAEIEDSYGYVGFGTDSPGWAEIDNVAITPIPKATAIEKGLDVTLAANLVADIAVADMAEDKQPTPLEKPVLVSDTANKKVTWAAVTGASGYKVTVKIDDEVKFESKDPQTALEYNMSAYTAVGDYKVTVVAIAANTSLNFDSNKAIITYTVSAPIVKPDPGKPSDTNKGCSGCGNKNAAAAVAVVIPALVAMAFIVIKRK